MAKLLLTGLLSLAAAGLASDRVLAQDLVVQTRLSGPLELVPALQDELLVPELAQGTSAVNKLDGAALLDRLLLQNV